MIGKCKVVSAKEITRIEKLACLEGCHEEEFMERAGKGVSSRLESFVEKERLPKVVSLLTGKGNNAGDAYVAGCYLLQKGFQVKALAIYEEDKWGPLCSKQAKRFIEFGGKIHFLNKDPNFSFEGVLLDGLVGTGFTGAADGVLAQAIRLANHSNLPIIAIDVPSGLCATTGKVETVAINAVATIYLEFPKLGFFLEKGWDHVGCLWKETFGLPASYHEKIQPEAFLIEDIDAKKLLPHLRRTRNKYTAGYVQILAGSPSMTGAGGLSSYAALRAGAGIVRWFYLGSISHQPSVPLEIISTSLEKGWDIFLAERLRMDSLLVGPGMGRDKGAYKSIRKALSLCTSPVLIDADALFFLSKYPSFAIPKDSVLTPHKGELKRLLESHKLEGSFFSTCQSFVEKKNTTLLVKGAPNFLFSKGNIPYILPVGNPGMATAGSGDVLAGIIASLLAQKIEGIEAAILGCFLHGFSGDLAAQDKTPYCLIASDIIEYLPKAFTQLLK
ncbi:MAG: NAD(P)H-hydrate dehydratase [Verrucomicrobia bacterium]|nr:NAD(P)H-hydrate dehydratase [Verrucomicrobiota bacterium]